MYRIFLNSAVGDDATNPRFLKDFLHDCCESRFTSALFILLGNCVEEIAESSIPVNTTASDIF